MTGRVVGVPAETDEYVITECKVFDANPRRLVGVPAETDEYAIAECKVFDENPQRYSSTAPRKIESTDSLLVPSPKLDVSRDIMVMDLEEKISATIATDVFNISSLPSETSLVNIKLPLIPVDFAAIDDANEEETMGISHAILFDSSVGNSITAKVLNETPQQTIKGSNFPFDPGSCLHTSNGSNVQTSKGSNVIESISAVEVAKIVAESPQFYESVIFCLSRDGVDSAPIHHQLDEVLEEVCALPDDTSLVFDPGGSSFVVFSFSYQEPTRSKFSLLCLDVLAKSLYCVVARLFEWAYMSWEFSEAILSVVYNDDIKCLTLSPNREMSLGLSVLLRLVDYHVFFSFVSRALSKSLSRFVLLTS